VTETPNFKYFDDPHSNAEFTDHVCQVCGSKEHCLEGEYFDRGDEVVSVCLSCLQQGKVTVNIPDFIKRKIESVQDSKETIKSIDALSKTPPVPWIQYNDWAVCCGEFGRYIGEWSADKLMQQSQDGDGMMYLMSILDEFSAEKVQNPELFWQTVGRNTSIFMFECLSCNKRIAVAQSY
jgi:uncharacterized protein CbrC (UPF0167 family)